MVIRRIGVLSLAKIMGVLYAGLGLVIGLCFALFSLLGGGAMLASGQDGAGMGGGMMMGMGLGAAIIFPIFYGVIGFIGGLLTGWLFNLAAGFVGGLEIETQ
ncbi:MAG: hypothetical protein ACREO3_10590 [Arenimonas sp.]